MECMGLEQGVLGAGMPGFYHQLLGGSGEACDQSRRTWGSGLLGSGSGGLAPSPRLYYCREGRAEIGGGLLNSSPQPGMRQVCWVSSPFMQHAPQFLAPGSLLSWPHPLLDSSWGSGEHKHIPLFLSGLIQRSPVQ